MKTEKQVISPFEYAIRMAAEDPDLSKFRPETREEKEARLHANLSDFLKRIKVKKS